MPKFKHIIIVAGEASGDMHGAHLVEEIKRLDPTISFSGLGGQRMKSAGVHLYEDLTQLAVIGFWEVLTHYKEIKRIFHLILGKVKKTQPKAVILIDYPGFNLRLASELKKMGIRVIYYISPQIWAWKKNRVFAIKKYVDQMLVLFDFEKRLYDEYGINAVHVGHPLADSIKVTIPREELLSSVSFDQGKTTIGILPGSRQKEVQTLLPIMLESASLLDQQSENVQFLIVQAQTIEKSLIEKYLSGPKIKNIQIVSHNTYNAINACDFCLVASGTATLETALLLKPMVVIYKTSLFTWLLAKIFVKIPDIGLVNVVAGKRIVPECVQFQAKPLTIFNELNHLICDPAGAEKIKSEMKEVQRKLNRGGASVRAAKAVLGLQDADQTGIGGKNLS